MIEPIFEITQYPRPNPSPTFSPTPTPTYHDLVQSFSTNSYALYSEYFIKKIVEDAQTRYHYLLRCNLKRNLRRCVRRFMMNQLEIVFLGYYCGVGGWGIWGVERTQGGDGDWVNGEEEDDQRVSLYLDLNAYFIKYYIGNTTEFNSIHTHLSEIRPEFTQIYQKWVLSKPKQIFTITPRKINELYREFSMGTIVQSSKKSYNQLVDTLIQLSTTYSIIPNKKGEKRDREREREKDKEKDKERERDRGKEKEKGKDKDKGSGNAGSSSMIRGLFGSDRKNQEEERRDRDRGSEIFQVVDNSGIIDEELPRFNIDFMSNRTKRKSSMAFQSLQSLSRKSQLLALNKQKQQPHPQPQAQPQQSPQPQPQRSRQKKPPKISLTFKRKQQKPNETVLGFLKQPSILNSQPSHKQHEKQRQRQRGRDPRSILNQSIKEHNMSFLNLRSNRSSRSNSQLPFLWKPSEDNFFQKSKFG